jgi:hypothetical protein
MSADTTLAKGYYTVDHVRNGEIIDSQTFPNLVCDEGLSHLLDVTLNGATQITAWYLALYEANYTPQADDTAANISSRATESTAYTEGTRVLWDTVAATGNAVTNSASRATFTINATKTMYGVFLASNSAKQSTSGKLISVALFTNARSVISGDELVVTYTLTASDV